MAKLNKKQVEEAVQLLFREYPDAGCELKFGSNFQLLVSVVLSAQTTDAGVNRVTSRLFERAPDAFAMSELSEEEIQDCIRSIGMYRTKAAHVSGLSKILAEKYEGEVPGEYEKLIELPGVGRKTANVVLAEAFGEPRIAVDTHVFRLANRIGFVSENDVYTTEKALMKLLAKNLWVKFHHAMIWHGRRVCSATKPACRGCCLEELCKRNGLQKRSFDI